MVKKQERHCRWIYNYFVNVGPKLAKHIIKKHENSHVTHYLRNNNPKTMFLKDVTESEITYIVRNCKNKKSTSNDNTDMSIIKKFIPHIVKPLTHICNNSFKNGVFPDSMKIAKVIPLFKSLTITITNYTDLFLSCRN